MPPSLTISAVQDTQFEQMNGFHQASDNSPLPRSPNAIRFCVLAPTYFGQQILIAYVSAVDDAAALQTAAPCSMTYEHPSLWTVTLPSVDSSLRYKYLMRDDDQPTQVKWEVGSERLIDFASLPLSSSCLLVRDVWRSKPDPSIEIFSTAAFNRVVFRPQVTISQKMLQVSQNTCYNQVFANSATSVAVVFKVFVERVVPGDQVCIFGDCDQLGNFDPANATVLADTLAPIWSVTLLMPKARHNFKYSFFIRRGDSVIVKDKNERELYLNGSDRSFLSGTCNQISVIHAPFERSFLFEKRWRGAGIALPVFSIRSHRSCGIGEFMDLIRVVDLCKATGYQLLQLLPINDTNVYNDFRDSYPYSAVSSFALHPQYLSIDELGDMPEDIYAEYDQERTRLNQKERIDVVDVMRVKMKFVREIYKLQSENFLQSPEFKAWFAEQEEWLVPYALFRFFMHVNGTAQFDQWGVRSRYSAKEMVDFSDPSSFHYNHLALVYYIQFHLHKQLRIAAEHAEANGVVFKGDLPIGVNRYCADTWTNPHLFRLQMQAGAPPDFFSTHGQNWLFPTYNWELMRLDNYGWWRARLGHMARYFHAYRIDHILGFFRIWEIPERFRTGMSGRFFPAHAITRQELESKGLWDMDRYTKPYVHDGILQQMFGDSWWKVREKFFEPLYENRLQFKKMYNTEKKVEKALKLPDGAPEHEVQDIEQLIKKLFDLFNNVCLLKDEEEEDLFHPRFMMQTTSSHAELPSDEWKGVLYELQNDYMHQRQNDLWKSNGLERLPMMKAASDMLVCGEDLGLIPECVPSVMEETCIISLAVQRMPPGDAIFGVPSDYKYECVATTSSHDTSTFRGWWEEISDDMRMKYWTQLMHRSENQSPPVECSPEIVEWAIVDHLRCPAMWAIFPLQDLLGMDPYLRRKDSRAEQINDPSNPNHVWCFRLHLDIETILANDAFLSKLRRLNEDHGRGLIY